MARAPRKSQLTKDAKKTTPSLSFHPASIHESSRTLRALYGAALQLQPLSSHAQEGQQHSQDN